MSDTQARRTILAADIGATWTHLGLIERVAGSYRLAARVEAPTRSGRQVDLQASLCGAIERMQHICGRTLLADDDSPIVPREGDRGSDMLVVTTSAGGPLRCALIGLTEGLSLEPGRRACTLTGTQLVAEASLTQDRANRHRALAGIRAALPDVIVMVGGVDAGPTEPFTAAATVLAALFADLPFDERPVFVFAGNLEARRPVAEALGDSMDYRVVENTHPRMGESTPQELQRELARVHLEHRLPRLDGYREVSSWVAVPIMASDTGTGIVLQYLSRQGRYGKRVLGVDVGGAGSWAALSGERPTPVQVSGWGTAAGLERALEGDGFESIRRWLPDEQQERAALGVLRNSALRPQTLPDDSADSAILLAATREALREPLAALESLTAGATRHVDLIAARGGGLAQASAPHEPLLTILDAVQPLGLSRVIVDWASMWPQLGALARYAPMAAAQVLERDAIRDLGYVYALESEDVAEHAGIRFRLAQASEKDEGEVSAGSLMRIPLDGDEAHIEVSAAREGAAGREMRNVVRYTLPRGSHSLVIDARGRLLQLPNDDAARRQEIAQWQSSLQ